MGSVFLLMSHLRHLKQESAGFTDTGQISPNNEELDFCFRCIELPPIAFLAKVVSPVSISVLSTARYYLR